MHHANRFTTSLVLALTLGAGACLDEDVHSVTAPDLGVVDPGESPPSELRVYTQNMWLGGETGPLFTLPFGDLSSSDPAVQQQALGQIIQATNVFFGQVQESDIPARAAAIVDEIEKALPNVVGLQEAMGYATGSLNLGTFSFTPTAGGPDLLVSVMEEIAVRGLPYSVGVMQPTTQIALPLGPPDATGEAPALGVQDRIVMLVHDDVSVADAASGVYTARIPLGPANVLRGWAMVTLGVNGLPHHVIATHLEGQGSGPGDPQRLVHNAQADELQAMASALDGNVILMGDLNSDANADPSARSWTPTYGKLTDAGFMDVWTESPHRGTDEGVTCCFEPGRTPDERIDFVLLRKADRDDGRHRGSYRTVIVGDEVSDMISGVLWPSDHAGIIADITEPIVLR